MHKTSSKTVYWSIQIENYLQQFMSIIWHFYRLFAINYKCIRFNWNITVNDCSSVQSITEINFVGKCPGWYIWFVWHIAFHFSQRSQHFLASLLVFSSSNNLTVLIPHFDFASDLSHYIPVISILFVTLSHT